MASGQLQGLDLDPAGQSDADLLAYMAMAGDDPSGARRAWETFYLRHVDYLNGVCVRAYGRLFGGPEGSADIVAETFRRAFEHADKYDPAGLTDDEQLRRRTRAWLGRIAQRIAQTALRGRGRLGERQLEQDHWGQIAPPGKASGEVGPLAVLAREALESLSDREQTVLRVTLQWYRPGADNQRLPNDIAADLARSLGTTTENLRQIRLRALRKIRARLAGKADGK